ncbi:MAG: TonB-dependent receptor [Prevotellaceae bacterium]|nr:TonB-dependent receptor [Prevotella sp.]MDD7257406.1 TonB-dependent receptor [Prevotellaceae bacterium]MDY6129961.1 TonB-dependent receptor [Prevotella sp.]
MYKSIFNKRETLKFKSFGRKGYSLFVCLGKEVLIGTLSVATLTYAKAGGISTEVEKVDSMKFRTNKEVMLDGVEITASRAPLALGQAARMVTVLDREQIAQAPVQSVNDLLKYAVGVDVRQRGAMGAQTDVGIRGGSSEQITILLNGINICDPHTGHNVFDFPVDLSEIERIEVLEGPAGRIYGTSSLMGAINIVTRLGAESSGDVHAEGGSFGYVTAGARANVKSGHWNNQISGNVARSDGFSRSKAGNLNADYSGGKAFYQGRYSDDKVALNWHAGMSTKGFGSNTFYSPSFDEQYERTTKYFTAVQAETKGSWFHFRPSVYWNRNQDRFELVRGVETKFPFNYHRADVFGINLNTYFDWSLGRTALGAEFRNEDIVSGNLGEPLHEPIPIHGTERDYQFGLNRSNLSFNFEHNILLNRFTLSAGFIAVKNTWNRMPFTIYPGVDASYRIGDHLKVYASYNSSLRMPSFTELFYSVGGHKADKYLKPEEMQAVEGGLKYFSDGVTGSVSVYYHHCLNMIDWVQDSSKPNSDWESVNYTKVNSLGFEASLALNFQRLLQGQDVLRTFNVAYSYIDEDKQGALHIQTRSKLEYLRHKLVASLQTHLFASLDFGVNYRFQDRTGSYVTVDKQVCDYEPYSLVDARLSWNRPEYTLYVEANNLFDKTYVDYGSVPQPGIWIIAGAKWHFKL